MNTETKRVGRPKLTERDRLWNEIRGCLLRSAMNNMTIPQAKVFAASVVYPLGLHFRNLVDMEIIEELESFIGHANEIPESVLKTRVAELKSLAQERNTNRLITK